MPKQWLARDFRDKADEAEQLAEHASRERRDVLNGIAENYRRTADQMDLLKQSLGLTCRLMVKVEGVFKRSAETQILPYSAGRCTLQHCCGTCGGVRDMAFFDPIAVAIDWLDAYRAASISIVEMYADAGSLECGCASAALHNRTAITEYWRKESPAGELMDLQPLGENVIIRYRVPDGIVRAVLQFDSEGKISRSFCSTTH